jgi:hypothetical protein
MPFRKATNYSRFNVGEYMRKKRLGWIAKVQKTKEVKNAAQNLQRLDTKVGNVLNCPYYLKSSL